MTNLEILRLVREVLSRELEVELNPQLDSHIEQKLIPSSVLTNLKNTLDKTSQNKFISKLTSMKDFILVDIGGLDFGAKFSVHIAAKNPSCKVLIYNPLLPFPRYPDFLFNGINKQFFRFNKKTELNESNPEKSINTLYSENNLDNISFIMKAISKEELIVIRKKYPNKTIIIYSENVPTVPIELTSVICEFVKGDKNCEFILMPLINTPINAYSSDILINKINSVFLKVNSKKSKQNKDSILMFFINIYYALLALQLARKGKLYFESDPKRQDPFDKSVLYISSI